MREDMAGKITERLQNAYYGQADTFRHHINGDHIDQLVEGAIDEFLAESVTFDDIIRMIEYAAYARIGEFFSLHCLPSDLPAGPPEWIRHADEVKARALRNA